jgi:hypothetical protein
MNFEIYDISVDRNSLHPRLVLDVFIDFQYRIQAPISISGQLYSSQSKLISTFSEAHKEHSNSLQLSMLSENEINKNYREKRNDRYRTRLVSQNLLPTEINHIEELREADRDKSVTFYIDVDIKYLSIPEGKQCNKYDNRAFNFYYTNDRKIQKITQEAWIKNFAPSLNIGEFVLLEFGVFDKIELPDFWKKLFAQLQSNLTDMQKKLKKGDWKEVMFYARKFYENIKIGDPKKAHKPFREECDKLLLANNHDEVGIQNLYDAIWKFFEFTSKYIHDKDGDGNLKPTPIAQKEDAYFAYTMAVGLFNLLGQKLK